MRVRASNSCGVHDAQPSRQALELFDLLRAVDSYGLEPGDYGMDLINARAGEWTAETLDADWSQYDFVLTRAAVRLITHLHYGRIDPHRAGFELPEPRSDLDLAATVAQLASAHDVTHVIAAAEPQFHHYALLKAALARYRSLAGRSDADAVAGCRAQGIASGRSL